MTGLFGCLDYDHRSEELHKCVAKVFIEIDHMVFGFLMNPVILGFLIELRNPTTWAVLKCSTEQGTGNLRINELFTH